MADDGVRILPARRRSSPSEFVDRRSLVGLVAIGLAVYLALVLSFTAIDILLTRAGWAMVQQTIDNQSVPVTRLSDLLYFNFVTVMTIGYGDLTPAGWGRLIACLEAVAGVAVFGALVSAAVLKLTLPRKSTVVFSKFCYFTLEDARFVLTFVNTSGTNIVNAGMCSMLRLGRADWCVRPSIRTPYIGFSGWPFSVNLLADYLSEEELKTEDWRRLVIYPDDGIKFGIQGALGVASFSSSVKYSLTDCWVLRSKSDLPTAILQDPKWGTREFEEAFHFIPESRVKFADCAKERGARVVDG